MAWDTIDNCSCDDITINVITPGRDIVPDHVNAIVHELISDIISENVHAIEAMISSAIVAVFIRAIVVA